MKYIIATAIAAAFVLPHAALAGADGSRQPAGGAHMSSYQTDPQHDPRSLFSQRNGGGQILGQPMLSESAGAHGVRRGVPAEPRWAVGRTGSR